MWDECNCVVVWAFFGIALGIGMKTDLFQSCGHCWVFQICWHIECSTFTASSFRIIQFSSVQFSRSVGSDSVWPHRPQPTRRPRPWDSPGKNTGLGCHFLLQCMKVKSESEVAQSCPTPSDPMDCSLPGSSTHGIFQARVIYAHINKIGKK